MHASSLCTCFSLTGCEGVTGGIALWTWTGRWFTKRAAYCNDTRLGQRPGEDHASATKEANLHFVCCAIIWVCFQMWPVHSMFCRPSFRGTAGPRAVVPTGQSDNLEKYRHGVRSGAISTGHPPGRVGGVTRRSPRTARPRRCRGERTDPD